MKVKRVDLEGFVLALLNAERLAYADSGNSIKLPDGSFSRDWAHVPYYKVQLRIGDYSGARVDRLRNRNNLTNFLRFPRVISPKFWSLDHGWYFGTFLADCIRHYGPEECKNLIVADGKLLGLVHEVSYHGGETGYGHLHPRPDADYEAVAEILGRRRPLPWPALTKSDLATT